MSQLDVLAMPLQGRQVIEASAGTGKTWTLAALYLRLVLGHGRIDAIGLKPSQILVMTFTDAATAELRERIRQRLGEAAHYLDDVLAERTPKADPFLHDVSQALTQQGWAQAAAQCHAAAQSMDDAAIFTIHAWSRRIIGAVGSTLCPWTHSPCCKRLGKASRKNSWPTSKKFGKTGIVSPGLQTTKRFLNPKRFGTRTGLG